MLGSSAVFLMPFCCHFEMCFVFCPRSYPLVSTASAAPQSKAEPGFDSTQKHQRSSLAPTPRTGVSNSAACSLSSGLDPNWKLPWNRRTKPWKKAEQDLLNSCLIPLKLGSHGGVPVGSSRSTSGDKKCLLRVTAGAVLAGTCQFLNSGMQHYYSEP